VTFPDISVVPRQELKKWIKGQQPAFADLCKNLSSTTESYSKILLELNISLAKEPHSAAALTDQADSDNSFVPTSTWLQAPNDSQFAELAGISPGDRPLLPNGRAWPPRVEFHRRVKDFLFDNQTGFHALSREPRNGVAAPQIVYGRNFFIAYETLVQYWDCTLDEYIPPNDEEQKSAEADSSASKGSAGTQEPRKRIKFSPERPVKPEQGEVALPLRRRGIRTINRPPKPPGTYKGWRIACGSEASNEVLTSCVKALVEAAVYPFGLNLAIPHKGPNFLELPGRRIVVPMSFRLWRIPKDRNDARKGLVEGPVLGIACRNQTGFGGSGAGAFASVEDTLLEVGSLLLLLQERSREGRKEISPGHDKWWAAKPRWGGGKGGEVPGEYQGEEESVEKTEKEKEDSLADFKLPPRKGSKFTEREQSIEDYKSLVGPKPRWDPRAKYMHIGREAGSEYDEVRLIVKRMHCKAWPLTINLIGILGLRFESSCQRRQAPRPRGLHQVYRNRRVSRRGAAC
jgi:hypothetical protein